MRYRSYAGFIVALAVMAFSPGTAKALTILTANSGLDLAVGCTNSSCFSFPGDPPAVIYDLTASAPVSGTFGITGLTLDFSIDLATANLTGPDGAVTSVDFSPVNYFGSVSVVDQGSGNFNVPTQTAEITGTLTPNGAGSPVNFTDLAVNVSGICGFAGNILTCGLTFGSGTAFELAVNGNPRFFRHTVDVTAVVPEPGTALLMGLGLSFLACGRRARA